MKKRLLFIDLIANSENNSMYPSTTSASNIGTANIFTLIKHPLRLVSYRQFPCQFTLCGFVATSG